MVYDSPAALRQALEARLQNEGRSRGIDLQRLRRRAVFERLLARLERSASGQWVLKGGMALEIRLRDRARTTKDLDLALRDGSREASDVRDLLVQALSEDREGDGFEFRVQPALPLDIDEAGHPGWRYPVEAHLAGRLLARVRVDVVPRAEEITATERLRLPGVLAFAGIPTLEVEAVDRRQHFAEKLHALTRTYRGERPSSRVKDLPDLILLIEDGLEPSASLLDAVEKVFGLRATHPLPTELADPSPDWEPTYAALVEELDIPARTMEDAMRQLREFWSETMSLRKEVR